MKITNTGNKILTFGKLTLLPGDYGELPKEYEGNPVIKHFQKSGIVFIGDKAVKAKREKSEELKTDVKKTKEEIIAGYKQMKREGLVAIASEKGIEVTDEDTKEKIAEKLASKEAE